MTGTSKPNGTRKASILNGAMLLLVLAVGFTAVFFLSNIAEARRPPVPEAYMDDDLSLEGKKLNGFVLGAEGLIADWYWMQSLQYIGDKFINAPADEVISLDDLSSLDPRLLYPYLDNATDLDPHFIAAYSYGATVLPAIDPEQAKRLTEKGIAANPDNFRLYQYLGFIYWKLRRYDLAAETYERGAAIPGAPPFLKSMAAYMASQGGSRETARQMYRQMLESDDQQTRNNAEYRLGQLDAMDELDAINAKLAAYREKAGTCVRSLREIESALSSMKLPNAANFRVDASGDLVDPKGTPYILNASTCVARSSSFPDAGKK